MRNIFDKIRVKRRYLIIEADDLNDVIALINGVTKWYICQSLEAGCCEWSEDPTKWYVHFDASNDQWKTIVAKMIEKGFELCIKDGAGDIYLKKTECKTES